MNLECVGYSSFYKAKARAVETFFVLIRVYKTIGSVCKIETGPSWCHHKQLFGCTEEEMTEPVKKRHIIGFMRLFCA